MPIRAPRCDLPAVNRRRVASALTRIELTMHISTFHYWPLVPLVFLLLVIVGGLVVAALQIGIISYAYEKMGVSEGWVTALLLGSLLGSYINIPVAELGGGQHVSNEAFSIFGVRHVMPVVHNWPGTVLAVNVGGAIIPTVLSLYLLTKNRLFGRAFIGVAIVALVVHAMAQPIEGKGIAVPIFVPPILSALVAMILRGRRQPRWPMCRAAWER